MPKMTMVVDLDRCIGCYGCEMSCKQENDVALGQYWNKVDRMGPYGDFPDVKMYWLPKACQQCENPACVNVCPTGASHVDADGVVLVDADTCIGCLMCMDACPYGARSLNKATNTVQKCTLCEGLREEGGDPACVKNCPAKARIWGDAEDPESDVAKALAAADPGAVHSLADTGSHPSVRYILSERIAPWQE